MCIGIMSCSFQKYSATQRVNRTDTIRFGQYYLDNGQANFPLILVYDSKTGQQLDKVENGKEYIIELKAGKFNHYRIKAEALNNGKVVKTKKHNQFRLQVKQADKQPFMKLKCTYLFEQDQIFLQIREWKDSTRTAYEESITQFDPVSILWIAIK